MFRGKTGPEDSSQIATGHWHNELDSDYILMYNIELYVEDYGMIHFGLTKTVEGVVNLCFIVSKDLALIHVSQVFD